MTVSNQPELLYTIHEVSEVIKLSERTISTLVKDNEIPHIRIRRSLRFPVTEIEKWIAVKAQQLVKTEGAHDQEMEQAIN